MTDLVDPTVLLSTLNDRSTLFVQRLDTASLLLARTELLFPRRQQFILDWLVSALHRASKHEATRREAFDCPETWMLLERLLRKEDTLLYLTRGKDNSESLLRFKMPLLPLFPTFLAENASMSTKSVEAAHGCFEVAKSHYLHGIRALPEHFLALLCSFGYCSSAALDGFFLSVIKGARLYCSSFINQRKIFMLFVESLPKLLAAGIGQSLGKPVTVEFCLLLSQIFYHAEHLEDLATLLKSMPQDDTAFITNAGETSFAKTSPYQRLLFERLEAISHTEQSQILCGLLPSLFKEFCDSYLSANIRQSSEDRRVVPFTMLAFMLKLLRSSLCSSPFDQPIGSAVSGLLEELATANVYLHRNDEIYRAQTAYLAHVASVCIDAKASGCIASLVTLNYYMVADKADTLALFLFEMDEDGDSTKEKELLLCRLFESAIKARQLDLLIERLCSTQAGRANFINEGLAYRLAKLCARIPLTIVASIIDTLISGIEASKYENEILAAELLVPLIKAEGFNSVYLNVASIQRLFKVIEKFELIGNHDLVNRLITLLMEELPVDSEAFMTVHQKLAIAYANQERRPKRLRMLLNDPPITDGELKECTFTNQADIQLFLEFLPRLKERVPTSTMRRFVSSYVECIANGTVQLLNAAELFEIRMFGTELVKIVAEKLEDLLAATADMSSHLQEKLHLLQLLSKMPLEVFEPDKPVMARLLKLICDTDTQVAQSCKQLDAGQLSLAVEHFIVSQVLLERLVRHHLQYARIPLDIQWIMELMELACLKPIADPRFERVGSSGFDACARLFEVICRIIGSSKSPSAMSSLVSVLNRGLEETYLWEHGNGSPCFLLLIHYAAALNYCSPLENIDHYKASKCISTALTAHLDMTGLFKAMDRVLRCESLVTNHAFQQELYLEILGECKFLARRQSLAENLKQNLASLASLLCRHFSRYHGYISTTASPIVAILTIALEALDMTNSEVDGNKALRRDVVNMIGEADEDGQHAVFTELKTRISVNGRKESGDAAFALHTAAIEVVTTAFDVTEIKVQAHNIVADLLSSCTPRRLESKREANSMLLLLFNFCGSKKRRISIGHADAILVLIATIHCIPDHRNNIHILEQTIQLLQLLISKHWDATFRLLPAIADFLRIIQKQLSLKSPTEASFAFDLFTRTLESLAKVLVPTTAFSVSNIILDHLFLPASSSPETTLSLQRAMYQLLDVTTDELQEALMRQLADDKFVSQRSRLKNLVSSYERDHRFSGKI